MALLNPQGQINSEHQEPAKSVQGQEYTELSRLHWDCITWTTSKKVLAPMYQHELWDYIHTYILGCFVWIFVHGYVMKKKHSLSDFPNTSNEGTGMS